MRHHRLYFYFNLNKNKRSKYINCDDSLVCSGEGEDPTYPIARVDGRVRGGGSGRGVLPKMRLFWFYCCAFISCVSVYLLVWLNVYVAHIYLLMV